MLKKILDPLSELTASPEHPHIDIMLTVPRETDILIAVMGVVGTGKSFFIDQSSDNYTFPPGKDLYCCSSPPSLNQETSTKPTSHTLYQVVRL